MPGPFNTIGDRFAPTLENAAEAGQQQAQLLRSQTPLEVRNLQLPTTISPRAPISRMLMEPKPNISGVNPDKAVLASIIRAMMGQGAVLPDTTGITTPRPLSVAPAGSGGGRAIGDVDDGGRSSGSPSPVPSPGRDPGPVLSGGGKLPDPVFTPGDGRPLPTPTPPPIPGDGGGRVEVPPPTNRIPQDPDRDRPQAPMPGGGGDGGRSEAPNPNPPVMTKPPDPERSPYDFNPVPAESSGPFGGASPMPFYKRDLYDDVRGPY